MIEVIFNIQKLFIKYLSFLLNINLKKINQFRIN